jgi:hypothetical protein
MGKGSSVLRVPGRISTTRVIVPPRMTMKFFKSTESQSLDSKRVDLNAPVETIGILRGKWSR